MKHYTLLCKPTDECVGCRDIAKEGFPFTKNATIKNEGSGKWDYSDGLVGIDVESCGEIQEYAYEHLIVFYCPVCGRYIYEEKT